jgi:CpeT/CpcT family (DUF1001)
MKFNIFIWAFCLFGFTAQAQNLQADLQEMLSWFTGEFNNFQQVWKEKEDKIADSLRHEHIHSIFLPVSIPALGKHVFFVKQYMDGDSDKIYRMRVYNFSVDDAEKAIRLDIFSFKNPADEKTYKNAQNTPSVLSGLTADNFTTMAGCGVFWRKEKEGYTGFMKSRACNFVSKRSGKRVFITDSLRLTPNEIWIRDEAEDENGNYVFGHKGKIHHKLMRCRTFKGWVAVKKEGTEDDYHFMQIPKLHDQGFRVRAKLPDGTPTPYEVELSQVIYQNAINVMKLAVYEDGKSKAISYTWTNPDAKRIGINLRFLQSGLTLVAPEMKNMNDLKK